LQSNTSYRPVSLGSIVSSHNAEVVGVEVSDSTLLIANATASSNTSATLSVVSVATGGAILGENVIGESPEVE
jgi:membrane protein DedA with SNARE-associated domain